MRLRGDTLLRQVLAQGEASIAAGAASIGAINAACAIDSCRVSVTNENFATESDVQGSDIIRIILVHPHLEVSFR